VNILTSLAGGLWKRPPVLLVLILNLVPVACVIWLHWSILMLLVVYWMENVVVGVFTAAKMVAAGAAKGWLGGVGALLFSVPFFVIHYGVFCLGHGLFVLAIGGLAAGGGLPLDDPFTAVIPLLAPQTGPLLWTAAALAASQAASFVRWLRRGEFRATTPDVEMAKPYGRIVVLHLTLLFGAFLAASLHDPVWVVALLGVLKTIYETAVTANRVKAREGETIVAAAA
jgi:hypothetical protein